MLEDGLVQIEGNIWLWYEISNNIPNMGWNPIVSPFGGILLML